MLARIGKLLIMLELSTDNNIYTGTEKSATIAGEYMPVDKPLKTVEKSLDQSYIYEYLKFPEKGKLSALRLAGHHAPTRQLAYQLHNRLSGQIDKELDKLIKQDAALGRATLVSLCKSSQSDSVRAACAAKLMEYADKTKPQRIIYETDNVADIDKEIAQLQERIKTGMNSPE